MRRAGSPTLAIGLKINPYEYRCKRARFRSSARPAPPDNYCRRAAPAGSGEAPPGRRAQTEMADAGGRSRRAQMLVYGRERKAKEMTTREMVMDTLKVSSVLGGGAAAVRSPRRRRAYRRPGHGYCHRLQRHRGGFQDEPTVVIAGDGRSRSEGSGSVHQSSWSITPNPAGYESMCNLTSLYRCVTLQATCGL